MENPSVSVSATQAGSAVLVCSIGCTLLGMGMLSAGFFVPGISGLVLWTLARFLSKKQAENLRVSRRLPKRAYTGKSFAIESIIENGNRFLPFIGVSFRDSLAAETKRSITISPGKRKSLTYPGRHLRRGPCRSGSWTARSQWPLGLFEMECRGRIKDETSLLLLPLPFLPKALFQHLESLDLNANFLHHPTYDPAAEFRLLREFRHGDSVRAIHWPSSLKSERLQVKEPDPPSSRPLRYGLILHSFTREGALITPQSYETILRICMGLLVRFQDRGIELVYYSGSGESEELKGAPGYRKAMDALATIRPTPIRDFSFLDRIRGDFRYCDEVFVLSDCRLSIWEREAASRFDRVACIDSSSFNLAAQPAFRRKLMPDMTI